MTLNDLERLFDVKIRFRPALCCSIDASFGAHCTNLNEDIDPYRRRQKCRPMTLVSENIRFMRIFTGDPLGGGVIGGCRRRLFLARDTASNIIMTICYPLSTGKWLQSEWPWMSLSGYFLSKCVFGQHLLNQSVWMSKINTTSATLRCSVHCISVSLL